MNKRLVFAFFVALAAVVAQDPTSFLTPDVLRVGEKLACRCGCSNTVGNCPMLHCSSADPMRRRIFEMQKRGLSDANIVSAIVREEGIAALAAPPARGIGPIITWIMPGVALLIGFFIYSRYVSRNRKAPEPLSAVDLAMIDRFQAQIDRELDESPEPGRKRPEPRK